MNWIERHIVATICLAAFGFMLLLAFWQATLILAALTIVGWGVYQWIRVVDRDHNRKLRNMQRLEHDAVMQDQWWMRGDPRGTHGHYPT